MSKRPCRYRRTRVSKSVRLAIKADEIFPGAEGFEASFEDFHDELFRRRRATAMQGLRTGVFRHGPPLGPSPRSVLPERSSSRVGKPRRRCRSLRVRGALRAISTSQFIVEHTARWPVALASFTVTPDGQLSGGWPAPEGERIAAPYAAKEFVRITLIQHRVGEFAAFFSEAKVMRPITSRRC